MFSKDNEEFDPENPTELVMKKDGDNILVWAVIDGEQIFHAAPSAKFSKSAINAALRTWFGRAFGDMISESDEHETSGGFM